MSPDLMPKSYFFWGYIEEPDLEVKELKHWSFEGYRYGKDKSDNWLNYSNDSSNSVEV